MMRPLAAALYCAVMGICTGCRDWPDPRILDISPAEMIASEQTRVEILADLPLPTTVDYAESTASLQTGVVLRIGRKELGPGEYPKDGHFAVDVPTVFEPGTYDVSITLEDGREAVREGGLTVREGQWPEGYSIDPIGEQQRLVPFTVTVRAMGPNATAFRGNVRFEVPPGASVGPVISARFVDGVLTQQIVINSTRSEELLIVSDVAGNRASQSVLLR